MTSLDSKTCCMTPCSVLIPLYMRGDVFFCTAASCDSAALAGAGATATVPRMYHSVASLVHTGAIITAGSNPQGTYAFQVKTLKSFQVALNPYNQLQHLIAESWLAPSGPYCPSVLCVGASVYPAFATSIRRFLVCG